MSTTFESQSKRTANVMLAVGWLFLVVNLAGLVLAVWGPIYLRLAPEDVLFSLQDGVVVARWIVIAQFVLAAFGVLQIWLLPRLACKMVADNSETRAADRVLTVAKWFAVALVVLTIVSLLLTTRTFRTWSDYEQSIRNQRQF